MSLLPLILVSAVSILGLSQHDKLFIEETKTMKRMISKYPGKCQKCQQPFPAETMIDWSPETKAVHANPAICAQAVTKITDSPKPTQAPEKLVPGVYEIGE